MTTDTASQRPLTGVSSLAPTTAWGFFVRAWRPFGGWVFVLVVAVRGAVLPLLQFAGGKPVDSVDFTALAALVGALGLGALRSFDRNKGTA